ncbi:MAG: MBOAT family protein [Magnetococcales bacterium]|nr:MBOAT family protein [Magnetococcales bacterium]
MEFNTYPFIALFLPITLLVYHLLERRKPRVWSLMWLAGASLFFYAWYNPANLGILLTSIAFNYALGHWIAPGRKHWLIVGIVINLALLAHYKYGHFLADNWHLAQRIYEQVHPLELPLAISFFTFQQISYLVDRYRNDLKQPKLLHYSLFVTFFPHLLAGPIVQAGEMVAQFAKHHGRRRIAKDLAVGITLFVLGLFKKVVLADGVATIATEIFSAVDRGESVHFLPAWCGALAFSFEIYFDFSGYSDMASGLARMFGFHLPLNFYSPYRATNIAEFWRRWHMTLSRFLRHYLYFPLGGSRQGLTQRARNVMLTMLLGGLWHGAGWTFVAWGGLHGVYLLIYHTWNSFRLAPTHPPSRTRIPGNRLLTFLAVTIAWVFFRAETFAGAWSLLASMLGLHGVWLPLSWQGAWPFSHPLWVFTASFTPYWFGPVGWKACVWIAVLWVGVWWLPNSAQFMRHTLQGASLPPEHLDQPVRFPILSWRPHPILAAGLALMFISTFVHLSLHKNFIYFQF